MAILPFLREVPKDKAQWDRFFRKATVGDADITNDKLRDSAGWSVIGRSAASDGTPDDIVALTSGEFLRLRGSLLEFGSIQPDELPSSVGSFEIETVSTSSTITYGKLYLATNTITLTLFDPVENQSVYIKNIGTGKVTVAHATATIDGESSQILLKNDTMLLISSASAFYIV